MKRKALAVSWCQQHTTGEPFLRLFARLAGATDESFGNG
jgi:hypothetical protein